MNINFVHKITSKQNVLNVCSVKTSNCDIYINGFVNIINISSKINDIIKYKLNITKSDLSNIIFNLENLHKRYIKGFLNRIIQGLYNFDLYKTETTTINSKKNISIYAPQISMKKKYDILIFLKHANKARDLLNKPSNKSTPFTFSNNIKKLFANKDNVTVKVLGHQEIRKQGLGLVYAIGKSSINKPRFLIIDYNPKDTKKTICLIGKGVTMDTGGYSMKSKKGMLGMHMDKTGASVCISLLNALYESKNKNRIIAICPLVENAVSDKAIKPGDVVKSYSGKTVEIVDTDAEGRLILADALSYACKNYKPDYIFDYATLTGWSERLHCHTSFAYFTLNKNISKNIISIGKENNERSIRIPPWTDYMIYLKSHLADVKNHGFECKNSDGFMASIFLMYFIPPEYRKNWVHFDMKTSAINNDLGIADGFATYLELVNSL